MTSAPPDRLLPETADPQLSTHALLERSRCGDARATDDLFSRLLGRVRRWAHGRRSARQSRGGDTADLVQDAALGAWRRMAGMDLTEPGALEAYIRQAVRNRMRDDWRRMSTRPVEDGLTSEVPTALPTPLEHLLSRESLDRYHRALAAVSPDDREAVIARVELGYSYEQVAQLVGKPTANAARLAVIRALDRIEATMTRSGG